MFKWISLHRYILGERTAMRVDTKMKDGTTGSAIFNHPRLSVAVGDATAAFASAVRGCHARASMRALAPFTRTTFRISFSISPHVVSTFVKRENDRPFPRVLRGETEAGVWYPEEDGALKNRPRLLEEASKVGLYSY